MSGLVISAFTFSGCAMIGPDYVEPDMPLAESWVSVIDQEVLPERAETAGWWKVFADPVLNDLVQSAVRDNRSLRSAALRVLEARASRGIAFGGLFPQTQQISANSYFGDRDFDTYSFDAAWELDFWGRFRRQIEAADADLLASLYGYDDVLVSLLADVAATYTSTRVSYARIEVAQNNVKIQARSLEIAEAKFRNGMVTELDVAQARSLLHDTEALIPGLEADASRSEFALALLLGLPPHDLHARLGSSATVPVAPPDAAVGAPAELLRRRPDLRRAERGVAAESARVGVAKSELLPHFSLSGSLEYTGGGHLNFFRYGAAGLRWDVLHYGRIRNRIRVQDARLERAIADYEQVVLAAQAEVESSLADYSAALRAIDHLEQSVKAAERALQLANIQYREGLADYVRVLGAQEAVLREQDRLVATRGSASIGLIAVYKALGGGWELRTGAPQLPAEVKTRMSERTNWGDLLDIPTEPAPES